MNEKVKQLQEQLEQARSLFLEALDCVEADEAARRESWPDEVERGELTLDLAGRIRAFLSLAYPQDTLKACGKVK